LKILHKRSSQLVGGSAKTPEASVIEYGELAVNFSTDDPALFIKDSNNQVVRIAGANNVAVQAYPGYGIAIEEQGIRIGDDWSAIPALP
jgi:hypothetical protein